MTEYIKVVNERLRKKKKKKKHCGKEENADYPHFLHFPLCLRKASFPGSLKL